MQNKSRLKKPSLKAISVPKKAGPMEIGRVLGREANIQMRRVLIKILLSINEIARGCIV